MTSVLMELPLLYVVVSKAAGAAPRPRFTSRAPPAPLTAPHRLRPPTLRPRHATPALAQVFHLAGTQLLAQIR